MSIHFSANADTFNKPKENGCKIISPSFFHTEMINLKSIVDLSVIEHKFIEGLNSRKLSKSSAKYYRIIAHQIVEFAKCNGKYSYYDGLSQDYMEHLNQQYAAGTINQSTKQHKTRTLRMLVSLAETGEIDFSRKQIGQKNYFLSPQFENLAQSIIEYSDIHERDYKLYITLIRHVLCYAIESGYTLCELDDDIILDFIGNEAPKTYSGSMNRVLRIIRCIAKYYQDHALGNIRYSYQNLIGKSKGRKLLPAYEESEVKAMIDSLETDNPIDRRNRAMILLGYTTGLRSVDIIKLKTTDLDLNRHSILIRQRKTGVPIPVNLPAITWNAIVEYILKYRPSREPGYLFMTGISFHKEIDYNLNCMMKSVERRAGISHIPYRGFHGLRRAFAISAASTGAPLETVSEMLGHVNMRSDRPYLSFNCKQVQFIALDFRDVPMKHSVYNILIDGIDEVVQ